jgi:aryl-alcohol dehydrogenase-like predicted oxidoreductase
MLPLCVDEKVGVIPWSPLARGRLTRDWDEATAGLAGFHDVVQRLQRLLHRHLARQPAPVRAGAHGMANLRGEDGVVTVSAEAQTG